MRVAAGGAEARPEGGEAEPACAGARPVGAGVGGGAMLEPGRADAARANAGICFPTP